MPTVRTAVRRSAALGLGALLTTLVASAVAGPAQAADTLRHPSHVITPIAGSAIAAADINDHGQVVGVTSVVPDNGQFVPEHGFLWEHGRMTDLGANFQPTAINNKGHILGRVSAPDGTPAGYGLWRNGTVTNLGNLGGSFFVVNAINDRDEVVGEGTLPDFSLRGFVWRNGTTTVLAPVPGGFSSMALGINNNGEIVGASRAADRSHAVTWHNGALTDLGPAIQSAYLVNDRGQIVGTRDVDATAHALLLSHGTVTDLGGLGTDFTDAHGLNNHTVIVGEGQVVEPQPFHAFTWAHGRIADLGEGSAVAVNNRGQIVVNRQHPGRVEIFD